MTQWLLPTVLGTLLLSPHASFGVREEGECLRCHGERSIVAQGRTRLFVEPARYGETSHKLVGCVSCHDGVSAGHPGDGIKPPRADCGKCHDPVAREYAASLHGRNARCADCHDPHQARELTLVSGAAINAVCARCHPLRATVGTHGKWLPQAGLHLDLLPCITCHTGSQNYFINLYIERQERDGTFRLAPYDELVRYAGDSGVPSLVDTNGDNFVSLQELRTANRTWRAQGMRLRGLMMPEVMTHSFQTLDNRWDCTFCHVAGTRNTQSSFVSFPTSTGAFRRLPAEKGAVLDILYGTPDFYMTGATRSPPLTVVSAVIIACGIAVPVGHGCLRFLTRRKRNHDHHDARVVTVYMQPTPVRIWHWIHALSIVTLCLTGLQIRFPEAVNLFGGFKGAVLLHNTAGIVVALSMIYWVLYYVVISHSIGRIYFPTGDEVKHGVVRQAVFYAFNYFRGRTNPFHATPQNKFNALQKIAYLVIMLVFMPVVIVTGFLLLDIQPLRSTLFMLGGIKLVDAIHVLAASCLCAFTFVHFYLTTLGPTPFWEIRTMWTGWEEEEVEGQRED